MEVVEAGLKSDKEESIRLTKTNLLSANSHMTDLDLGAMKFVLYD